MISAKAVNRYCDSIYKAGAVYVWGADGEIITKDLISKLIKTYGASNYSKIVMDRDEGKIGADCSGLLTNISGKNQTAAAYYSQCKEKGKSSTIPKNKVCLIFREESGKIVHVGVYMGNGKLTEMRNGCEQRDFVATQWSYWGMPDWIETQVDPTPTPTTDTITLTKSYNGYVSADDAINRRNAKTTVVAGTYYVYRNYKTATNVTKTKGTPGAWIVI